MTPEKISEILAHRHWIDTKQIFPGDPGFDCLTCIVAFKAIHQAIAEERERYIKIIDDSKEELTQAILAAMAIEREACALLAKQHGDLAAAMGHKEHMRIAASIEQAIRQRGKSEEQSK